MGARSMAQNPQPATPIQSATTRKRLRSESSMSRSIMRGVPHSAKRSPAVLNKFQSSACIYASKSKSPERHQERQLRSELQKGIRSGGKNEACTAPEVNAAEPRNPSEKLRSGASPRAMPEHLRRPSSVDAE